jgi:hypothetical protein
MSLLKSGRPRARESTASAPLGLATAVSRVAMATGFGKGVLLTVTIPCGNGLTGEPDPLTG